jgi:hypothetical protein
MHVPDYRVRLLLHHDHAGDGFRTAMRPDGELAKPVLCKRRHMIPTMTPFQLLLLKEGLAL